MLPCRLERIALQDAARHRRAAGVAVDAGERQRARAADQQAAATRHVAGIGAAARLIERHRRVVEDVALQTGRRALQDAARHRRATRVTVGARQDHRAGAELEQRPGARDDAGIGAVGALLEAHHGVVQDVALQARRRAAQDAARHRRAAAVAVGAAQEHRTRALLDEAAAAGDRRGHDGIVDVARGQRAGAQGDDAARARQGAHRQVVAAEIEGAAVDRERACRRQRCAGAQPQGAGVDRRAAIVGVGGGEGEGAGAGLGQATEARHDAAVAAVGSLVEHHGAVVGDVAQQGGGVALQGAARHRRAAGIADGAGQDERAGALLDEAARAADRARVGERADSDVEGAAAGEGRGARGREGA